MPSFVPHKGTPNGTSPSLEQYVEAIAELLEKAKACSVSEIADHVQVSRTAASRAVRELKEQGLVESAANRYVDLTSAGESLAGRLAARHETLYRFFTEVLLIDTDWADQEACRLEHQVDDDFIHRLQRLTDAFRGGESVTGEWAARFQEFLEHS